MNNHISGKICSDTCLCRAVEKYDQVTTGFATKFPSDFSVLKDWSITALREPGKNTASFYKIWRFVIFYFHFPKLCELTLIRL
jgi:hypothetical protein